MKYQTFIFDISGGKNEAEVSKRGSLARGETRGGGGDETERKVARHMCFGTDDGGSSGGARRRG